MSHFFLFCFKVFAIVFLRRDDDGDTFDDLKSRFVAAARAGVDVGAIIADRGYNKLSDVPKSEYADLLEALPEVT